MSYLLRVLLAVSVLAAPGAALAQCTKDTDCKGERVCDRGVCVSPADRAAPPPDYTAPPPPPPREPVVVRPPPPVRRQAANTDAGWDLNARKNVILFNVLSPIGAAIYAANNQVGDPGLSILQFSVSYERALFSHVSLFGSLTPNYWSDPTGTAFYAGVSIGAKYYFFGGAPDGFWAGGEVGTLPLDAGPGLIAETGYQWVLDVGLTFAVVGGLVFSGTATGGLGVGLGLGGHVGWNF